MRVYTRYTEGLPHRISEDPWFARRAKPGGPAGAVSRYFCAERDAREMQKYVPPVGRQPPSLHRGTSRRGAVRICFAPRTPLENVCARRGSPVAFGLLEIANVSYRNVNPFFPSGKSSSLADTCSGASTRTENCAKCKNTCIASVDEVVILFEKV